jgi:hypothetical protein
VIRNPEKTYFGSRIQGSKRHRIPDPDPQHCMWGMDEGIVKTQNPKCRLHWCLKEFLAWRHSQSCWYFYDPSCELLPLYLLSHHPRPSPLRKVNVQCTVYRQRMAVGGGGVLICVVDYILQEFNTLFLTRFRTCKIATPPQTKTPVKTIFVDWCLYSSLSMMRASVALCRLHAAQKK